MGKFKNSEIHDLYSDWKIKLINSDPAYSRLICSDIDRIWVEVDRAGKTVICVLDLKWEESGDNQTPTEKVLQDWFVSKGARYYTVFIKRDWSLFSVVNERGEVKRLRPIAFAEWLLKKRKV
jgi:hypothetical protein